MTNIDIIQKKIDDTRYWDMDVLDLKMLYFGDEIELVIDTDSDMCWKIEYLSCLNVSYITDANWRGPYIVKKMMKPQLGYVGQNITISESEDPEFYKVDMDLSIMEMHIECREIIVSKISKNKLNLFWINNK